MQLNASLACITSGAESEAITSYVSSLIAPTVSDVWIGLYHDPDPGELSTGRSARESHQDPSVWQTCASGERAHGFHNWAAGQPNEVGDECALLWSEFADWRWRDAPCSVSARCLCEARVAGSAGDAISSGYAAFATNQRGLASRQRDTAIRWLMLIYLIIVPCFASLVVAAPYLWHRTGGASGSSSSVAMVPTGFTATEALQACESEGAPAPTPTLQTRTALRLSVAEAEALRFRARVETRFLTCGWCTFVAALMPLLVPFFMPDPHFKAYQLYVGIGPMCAQTIIPWSIASLALALRPIDEVAIRRASSLLFCMMILGSIVVIASLMRKRTPAETNGTGREANPTYDQAIPTVGFTCLSVGFLVYGITLFPATSVAAQCVPCLTIWTPRQKLMRFWLVVRLSFLTTGAYFFHVFLTPLYRGGSMAFTGRSDDVNLQYILCALSYMTASAVLTPRVRAQVQLFFMPPDGRSGTIQEAAIVASLLSNGSQVHLGAADAYLIATRLFRGLPIESMRPGMMVTHEAKGPVHGACTQEELARETRPAKLGEVAAFVTYSWADDGVELYKQLQRWTAGLASRDEMIWLDRACMGTDFNDVRISLSCLPVFLSGCRRLLVLAGPNYSSRLWCSMELFVFVRMGGDLQAIDMRLIGDEPGREEVARLLMRFNAAKATCFLFEDREHLLGVIEATFGTPEAFNKVVRRIFADKVQHLPPDCSVSSTVQTTV